MTRDDIIRMALDTGFDADDETTLTSLERFASLVAEAERDACAKLCDTFKSKTLGAQSGQDNELSNVILRQVAYLGHAECAAAIRARSLA